MDLFIKENEKIKQPNSQILMSSGVFFIFFNTMCLSILVDRVFYWRADGELENANKFTEDLYRIVRLSANSLMNRSISIASSVLTVLLCKSIFSLSARNKLNQVSSWCDNVTIVSSILAGIASVGASSGNVSQESCVIIGSFGGIIYLLGTMLMERAHLDDPLQSTQIHMFCGMWGLIALGLFEDEKGLMHSGSFQFLGVQCLGALAILISTTILSYVYFKMANQWFHLRLSKIEELLGLDVIEDSQVLQAIFKRMEETGFDRKNSY